MDSETLFKHWRSHRGADRRDPLSEEGARSYSAIWQSWCRWLTETGGDGQPPRCATYLEASPVLVSSFLRTGPTPRASRRAKNPLSEITRRRYWRVLHSVYEHAFNQQLIAVNPAAGLIGKDKPPPENSVGQIFGEHQLAHIRSAIPQGESVWDVRDRALLLLLMEEALTVSEICGLQVRHAGAGLLDSNLLSVRIEGKRKAQARIVDLASSASKALQAWMDCREGLTQAQNMDPMFLTERLRGVSPRVVFHLVSRTVTKAFSDAGLPLTLHLGPQVLRNSCIVHWLNEGHELQAVLKKSGLKDAKSLRGLRRYLTSPPDLGELHRLG
jgi:integrase/recombinase XerC